MYHLSTVVLDLKGTSPESNATSGGINKRYTKGVEVNVNENETG
jgi:hypothetical protein